MAKQNTAVDFDALFKNVEEVNLDTQAIQTPALNRDLGAPMQETREAANNAAGFYDFKIPTDKEEAKKMAYKKAKDYLGVEKNDEKAGKQIQKALTDLQKGDMDAEGIEALSDSLEKSKLAGKVLDKALLFQAKTAIKNKNTQALMESWNKLNDDEKFLLFKEAYTWKSRLIASVYEGIGAPAKIARSIYSNIKRWTTGSLSEKDYMSHEIQRMIALGVLDCSPELMQRIMAHHDAKTKPTQEHAKTLVKHSGTIGATIGGAVGTFGGNPIAGAKIGAKVGTATGAGLTATMKLEKAIQSRLPEVREQVALEKERIGVKTQVFEQIQESESVFGNQKLIHDLAA